MGLLELLRSVLMRSSQTFVWSATALGLIALLSFFAAVGYDFYRSALQFSEQAARNVAMLIQQDVARNIELYDLSLQAVLDGLADPKVMQLEPELRRKALFDTSATAQGLGALVVLDENGSIVQDSRSAIPRKGNFADREYFIIHRDATRDIGLYVSRPFRARLQGGIWSISISRRVNRPDGSFGGIVSGTMKLDYFQQVFSHVALGADGSITLLRDDGVVILRNDADDAQIGSDWPALQALGHLPTEARGSFVGRGIVDGIERRYAFQRVGTLPLVVVVGLATDEVFSNWWPKILGLSGIFAVMAASVLFLVWLLDTELRRRTRAERAATALARTDGLTKLANRRAFEEALPQEWARAIRDGRPISLVMIDTDHFKRFNDAYGHPAGDRVLVAIAGVIAKAIKRPGDLGIRYGGEEFAVLLPDTDGRGAMQIAAEIQRGVDKLQIPHARSEHSIVTISAGIATTLPRVGTRATSLVRSADEALYQAKADGRNTIRVSASNVVSADFQAQANRAG